MLPGPHTPAHNALLVWCIFDMIFFLLSFKMLSFFTQPTRRVLLSNEMRTLALRFVVFSSVLFFMFLFRTRVSVFAFSPSSLFLVADKPKAEIHIINHHQMLPHAGWVWAELGWKWRGLPIVQPIGVRRVRNWWWFQFTHSQTGSSARSARCRVRMFHVSMDQERWESWKTYKLLGMFYWCWRWCVSKNCTNFNGFFPSLQQGYMEPMTMNCEKFWREKNRFFLRWLLPLFFSLSSRFNDDINSATMAVQSDYLMMELKKESRAKEWGDAVSSVRESSSGCRWSWKEKKVVQGDFSRRIIKHHRMILEYAFLDDAWLLTHFFFFQLDVSAAVALFAGDVSAWTTATKRRVLKDFIRALFFIHDEILECGKLERIFVQNFLEVCFGADEDCM